MCLCLSHLGLFSLTLLSPPLLLSRFHAPFFFARVSEQRATRILTKTREHSRRMSKQEGKVKQSCTHAMGMGNSTLAVECWKAQINKENQIRGDWRKKFAPHLEEKEAEVDMSMQVHHTCTRTRHAACVCLFLVRSAHDTPQGGRTTWTKRDATSKTSTPPHAGYSTKGSRRTAQAGLRTSSSATRWRRSRSCDAPKPQARYVRAGLLFPLQSHPPQSVGWACSELPPVTRTGVTNFGRKPVIKNGFYRKGGVFTN